MISEKTNSNSLTDLLAKSHHLAVCIREDKPTLEDKLIALALTIGLKTDQRRSFFSGYLEDNFSFPYRDQLEIGQGNRDLVIELPLKEEEIERVSTATNEKGLMELIIQPQEEKIPIPSDKVRMFYRGLNVDLVILVGVNRLEELGQLYLENNLLFQKVPLVHFYRKSPPLGSYNIPLAPTSSLVSFIQWLKKEKITLSSSAYDLLLWSLRYLTRNFNQSLTIDIAEAITWLLKQGAVDRPLIRSQQISSQAGDFNSFSTQKMNAFPDKRAIRIVKS